MTNNIAKIRAALEFAKQCELGLHIKCNEALAALAKLEKAAAEPVAEVGGDFALYWAGTGPIQPLIVRYNIKVGSFLYAAPPAPVAEIREVVVTDEMARRVYYSFDGDLRMAEAEQARLYLTAWRAELGPTLGLVELKEPTPEECCDIWREAKANEGDGSKVCAGRAMFAACRAVMWPKEGV